MSITTKDQQNAIVAFVLQNKGIVSEQFVPSLNDEGHALLNINWQRMADDGVEDEEQGPNWIIRVFDCEPYDDQIRAYVTETDGEITKIEIFGE